MMRAGARPQLRPRPRPRPTLVNHKLREYCRQYWIASTIYKGRGEPDWPRFRVGGVIANLREITIFAATHRLPILGRLTSALMQQVIMGGQHKKGKATASVSYLPIKQQPEADQQAQIQAYTEAYQATTHHSQV